MPTTTAENPVSPNRNLWAWSRATKTLPSTRRLFAFLTRGHRQRFEIGAICKEDAGVLGAKGMARIGSDSKAECRMAGTGGFKILHRQAPDGRAVVGFAGMSSHSHSISPSHTSIADCRATAPVAALPLRESRSTAISIPGAERELTFDRAGCGRMDALQIVDIHGDGGVCNVVGLRLIRRVDG
jgi:hypothetical protein